MTEQAGLFDLPPSVPPRSRGRAPGRGRAREIWRRTVTAEITLVDRGALLQEALHVYDTSVVIELPGAPPAPSEIEPGDPREEIAADPARAVEWCLDPMAGWWALLEADAVRVEAVEVEATATEHPSRLQARWSVAVKIRDAAAARTVARSTCPADAAAAAAIDADFAAVLAHATDAHAPLAAIPGITWEATEVTVQHVPRRQRDQT